MSFQRDESVRLLIGSEQGQVAIVFVAAIVGLFLVGALVIASAGSVIAHRAVATTASDTVALAGATDPKAALYLQRWYRTRGVGVDSETRGGVVSAQSASEMATAQSWASLEHVEPRVAPALVAVLARASQLLSIELRPVQTLPTAVELTPSDAAAIASLAPELGLCLWYPDQTVYGLC